MSIFCDSCNDDVTVDCHDCEQHQEQEKKKMSYLTDDQIREMAEWVLSNQEVSHLSHARKCALAKEYAADEFGIVPRESAVLLAVKVANLGWHNAVTQTKAALAAS